MATGYENEPSMPALGAGEEEQVSLSIETQEDESGVAEVRQESSGTFGWRMESMIFYNVEFDPGSG